MSDEYVSRLRPWEFFGESPAPDWTPEEIDAKAEEHVDFMLHDIGNFDHHLKCAMGIGYMGSPTVDMSNASRNLLVEAIIEKIEGRRACSRFGAGECESIWCRPFNPKQLVDVYED